TRFSRDWSSDVCSSDLAKPHIGHAYTTIAADVLARLNRQLGREVFFLTGTDEHGTKIEQAAAAQGKTPQELADEVSAQFSFAWEDRKSVVEGERGDRGE